MYTLYIQPSATIDIYREHVEALEMLLREINRSDIVMCKGDLNFGNSVSWIEIREHLCKCKYDFSAIWNSSFNIDDIVSYFYGVIYDTFDKFVPKSKIRKSTRPSWYNKELLSLKNTRNKL